MTKQKTFTNYQKMLDFTINLCYKGRDFEPVKRGELYIVRYV